MFDVSSLPPHDQEFLRNLATLFRRAKPSTTGGLVGILVSPADQALIIERLENLAAYGDSTTEIQRIVT